MKISLPILCLLLWHNFALAQTKTDVYKNSKSPIDARVEDLLSKMTLEEKVAQLQCFMGDFDKDKVNPNGLGNMTSIFGKYLPKEAVLKYNEMQLSYQKNTRLGIPVIFHGEAVFGLMANGITSFPQPIMQASTFNPALQAKMVQAISAEVRSRGYRQVLSPTINVAYDSRWGRTHETYGEDPLLVSRMGVAYIKTMESAGVICTPKHFAVNIGHNGKFGGAVHFSERFLREVELPPFKAAIIEAGAQSIMPAYNTIDGVPCVLNGWLLNDILRKEWNFKGYVSSDYGALDQSMTIHRISENMEDIAALGIKAGMDVEMPNVFIYGAPLINAVKSGKLPIALLDVSVKRVLYQKFRLGLFENRLANPGTVEQICDNNEHRALAREAARQGMVLLKNNKNVLPFSKDIKSVAVLGPLADNLLLGNYAGWGMKKVSILEGIKNKVGKTAKVEFEKGVELTQLALPVISPQYLFVPNDKDNKNGVLAEYFNNIDLKGKPVLTKIESTIDFEWGEGVPEPFINPDNYSVRWTARLVSPATGKFRIGMSIDDGARLYIDDKLIIDEWKGGSVRLEEVDFDFVKDKSYNLKMEYFEGTYNAIARLGWSAEPNANIGKAVALAQASDISIIVVGAMDGEGKDRADLDLTASQEDLINAVAKTGKPFVVVLATGNVITMMDWIDNAPAILEAWYSGEEGGNAVADVLFGDYNPGGKLPITFPKNVGQMPCYYFQKPDAGSSFIGVGNEPLFHFGHGLSYTQFEYSKISLSAAKASADAGVVVSIEVKNTGKVKGDEVVQLYIRDQYSSVATPNKQLKGFERISLEPGASKTVKFTLSDQELGLYNAQLKWVVEPGKFDVMIGSSSSDIRQKEVVEIY